MSKKEHLLLFTAMLAFVIIGGFSMWMHSMLYRTPGNGSLSWAFIGILLVAVIGQILLVAAMRSLQRKGAPIIANLSPSQELPPSIR